MSSMKSHATSSSSDSLRGHAQWRKALSLLLALLMLEADSSADEVRHSAPVVQPPVRNKGAITFRFPRTTIHLDSIRHPSTDNDERPEGREELLFSNGTFENLVFGPRETESEFFRRLNSELATRVELLGRTFELSHSQKRKLLLAGKKDIEHLRQRVNEFRKRFDETLFVEKIDAIALQVIHAWASDFVDDATEFRRSVPDDPFLDESMLAKVLHHQLTSEQIAEYERRELKLRVVPFGIARKKSEKT